MPPSPFPAPGSKRERTRSGLLVAAQELLLERSAGSLSIRDVAQRARVVHGTFYNYFASLEELFDAVGVLIAMEHARLLAQLTAGARDPAEVFARSTRQTLRFVALAPGYGRVLFDAGLPIDRLVLGLRAHLHQDIERGVAARVFRADDLELTVGMLSGCLIGVALDVHRGQLAEGAIDEVTFRLLRQLGVPPRRARALASAPCDFAAPPPLPLHAVTIGEPDVPPGAGSREGSRRRGAAT